MYPQQYITITKISGVSVKGKNIPVTFDAGVINRGENYPSVNITSDVPDRLAEYTDRNGLLGGAFSIKGDINQGKSISMAFPLPDRPGIINQDDIKLLHISDEGEFLGEIRPDSISSGAIYATLTSFSTFVPVMESIVRSTGYVGGECVYEQKNNKARLKVNLSIDLSESDESASASVTLRYLSQAVMHTVTKEFNYGEVIRYRIGKAGVLSKIFNIEEEEAIRLSDITISFSSSEGEDIVETINLSSWDNIFYPGETGEINAQFNERTLNFDPDFIGITKNTSSMKHAYSNISTPNGLEGRMHRLADNATENYFYVKDHLGSTRMTVYDDNAGTFDVAEATMYYSYGNMEDELSSSDVTREKFTGKEFDTEGAGDEGIGAFHFPARMYDPEVGVWMGRDPAGQFFNAYGYAGNPIIFVDPDGMAFYTSLRFMFPATTNLINMVGSISNAINQEQGFFRTIFTFALNSASNDVAALR